MSDQSENRTIMNPSLDVLIQNITIDESELREKEARVRKLAEKLKNEENKLMLLKTIKHNQTQSRSTPDHSHSDHHHPTSPEHSHHHSTSPVLLAHQQAHAPVSSTGPPTCHHHASHLRPGYHSLARSSVTTTSDDESNLSSFNESSVSCHLLQQQRSRSFASSVSDSSASCFGQTIKKVTLHLDGKNYLGMSIVGQANGGIYVGSLMKGGAVEAEGTIQPLDMILQVNDHVLSNVSNDEAVEILKEAVKKPGPITIVVVKSCEPNYDNFFVQLREEPIQPINLEVWLRNTEAAMLNEPIGPSSGSLSHSSVPNSEHHLLSVTPNLSTINNNMLTICKYAARPDSGLIIKDRKWLKIRIANAFLGRDLVDWLYKNVRDFKTKKDAYRYAKSLLVQDYIKITVAKKFSKNCYYVFDESVYRDED